VDRDPKPNRFVWNPGELKPVARRGGAESAGTSGSPIGLYLSYDAGRNLLSAYEFGRVGDSQPSGRWRVVTESFSFLLDTPGGREVGFRITSLSGFNPEAPEAESIWRDPRFDVPALGLRHASAGEIVMAARSFLGGESTLNRRIFNAAISAHGTEAAKLWRDCLESGDSMAHYGLGYTMVELGRYRDAYRHLRAYTEIVPDDAWSWCWLGRACHALGETTEARSAYGTAIELTGATGVKTEAPTLLARLDAGESAHLPDEQRPGVIRETVFDSPVYLSQLEFTLAHRTPAPGQATVLFLAGGPLSGKTSALRDLTKQGDEFVPRDAVLVEPRSIRDRLPEWRKLYDVRNPAAAELVFRESCKVGRDMTQAAVAGRRNLILDGIGASGDNAFASLLKLFAAVGYEARVLLVTCSPETAQSRNEQRAEHEGLLIDPKLLAGLHAAVSKHFGEWKDLPAIAVRLYQTD
jgi:tetratricopeptide (TPR) repeat protein